MDYYSENDEDTKAIGEKIGRSAKIGDVFCLSGDLGAGKTTFSKGFALGLNIKEQIVSPTFTIVNEYEGDIPLYHFDAYRLADYDSATCFDFEEYFSYNGVCLIEWAENIKSIIPDNAYHLIIERIEGHENKRRISIRCIENLNA